MNFLHLKYFLAVAEEMNITRAAERLYISQQSLSSHISNLERELDTKLFTRSPKLSLTYEGTQLVDTATQILNLHSQYLTKVGDISHRYSGTLRLGISYTCGLTLLPDILPLFQQEFPQVQLSVFEGNSAQLEDQLAHGRLDMIICFQPVLMDAVETIPLHQDRLILAVPKPFTDRLFGADAPQIRRSQAQGADIALFQDLPFILIKRGNRARGIVDQYFSRCSFKPKLLLELDNTITTLALAQQGMGVVVCPELFLWAIRARSLVGAMETLDLFPLTDPITLSTLVVGYDRERYMPHFAQRFIEMTQAVLARHRSDILERSE